MLAVAFTAAQWIVLLGTFFTGIGTCITAYAAVKRAKGETRTQSEIDCLDRLKIARMDEEELRDDVRRLRRKYEQ